ncbi:MAG: VWA domain-containing protein [Candidatus Aenigmarchaeota archaeon]|nr:VWA domain-containing protein [Candidatus Aenigmarchaeota archaeon]
MKGASKLLIKGIYLIMVIIAIAIVINQITSVNLMGTEGTENIRFRKDANDILETLVGSDKCLATKSNGNIEKIINISTLDEFQSNYSDIEPDCARDYEYGYYVKIEKFNFTKFIGKPLGQGIPQNNRDIVLILDDSVSMSSPPEIFLAVKSAANQLIKCLDNKTDRVAIVTFTTGKGPGCGISVPVHMTSLSTQQNMDLVTGQINGLSPLFGTPLIDSLKRAQEIITNEGNSSKFRMIILFTDGRETCCDACKNYRGRLWVWKCPDLSNCVNDPTNPNSNMGNCCCLTPCKDELCTFATNDLSTLKNPNSPLQDHIPIYSIFLGNDPIGISQTSCVSNQTHGKFYNITEETILPRLFCEIVSPKERETGEDYQSWYFGSRDHSTDKALKDSVTISIPVSIKISDTKTQPGLATIKLFKGELEELTGLIESTCETGLETRKKIDISYAVKLDGNSICMNNAGKINCRKFVCSSSVQFNEIKAPGIYEFHFKKEGNTVKVIV